jgi:TRAP-type mannitol/chloroaromatic compound transport system permease large subunit
MLAGLYIGYVIVLAKLRPELMPPLAQSERRVELPSYAQALRQYGSNALAALSRAFTGRAAVDVPKRTVLGQLVVSLSPALFILAILGATYHSATSPEAKTDTAGLIEAGGAIAADASESEQSRGLIGAPEAEEEEKPQELAPPPQAEEKKPAAEEKTTGAGAAQPASARAEKVAAPLWFWIVLAVGVATIALIYGLWSWERLEVYKMLLTSFFPLAILILMVLGSIVFGLATPSEAAAVGGFGGFILAAAYRYTAHLRAPADQRASQGKAILATVKDLGTILKESSFLTAKTSAMVCWLFVGSGIFSAAFALLGGQELIEKWVLSLDMTPVQFMMLAQFIIFILGWPLEWTEIIIIFMPIFLPLLPHFNIDPLFFGLLVALNLQTAFLSPPVAMAAFYLKGVSPPHVTLNQIFAGMMPFMGIQLIALVLLYVFPQIGLWLPQMLYAR